MAFLYRPHFASPSRLEAFVTDALDRADPCAQLLKDVFEANVTMKVQ